MKLDTEKILRTTPSARGAAVIFCPSPECKRPHIGLFDDNDQPIAQWVVPAVNADGQGFFKALQDAMYQAAVEREDKSGD
jgi:hypothetical protein